jgi:hypothetical protein
MMMEGAISKWSIVSAYGKTGSGGVRVNKDREKTIRHFQNP